MASASDLSQTCQEFWDQRKPVLGREQEEFIHSVKAQREKDEDKKAKGTHNGKKTWNEWDRNFQNVLKEKNTKQKADLLPKEENKPN